MNGWGLLLQLHPLPVELMTHPIPLPEADNSMGHDLTLNRLIEQIINVCDLYHSLKEMCNVSENVHISWAAAVTMSGT